MRRQKRATLARHLVSGLGPDKGLGVFVGDVQVTVDGSLQFTAALMHASISAQLLFGEQPKPALHQVQPGGAGGREMNMEAGPLWRQDRPRSGSAHVICSAKSTAVRRPVTSTCLHPPFGSQNMNRFRVTVSLVLGVIALHPSRSELDGRLAHPRSTAWWHSAKHIT